jgi:hypothetical protein
MEAASNVELQSPIAGTGLGAEIDPKQKEQVIRGWISRKESVCPYAPGLARFIHLPELKSLNIEHVEYLAEELNAFYSAKENNKRVGRWMLLPHTEWTCHEEAHTESERIFWLLNAAYFYLLKDKKSVQASLDQQLKGYNRGVKGEILNPIVGHQPNRSVDVIPAKSLFYSALSPLYNSTQFYRYCPHSLIPLVYASEFQQLKQKHPQVTSEVALEMACGGLFEILGDDISLDKNAFKQELRVWGAIIDRTAEIMRGAAKGVSSQAKEAKGCPASNLNYFRVSNPKLVSLIYSKYSNHLNILRQILGQTNAQPKQIIAAPFAGSGLYTIPDYLA